MVKNFVERLVMLPLYDAPTGDEGGGGGTDGVTPGADNNGAIKPGAGGTPDPNASPKPGAAPAKPAEDPRIKGLLADLKKEREARQKYERDYGTTNAELERERKRVLALSGIEPKSKEEEDEALIRERLERLYPWLKDMSAEDIKAIRESRGHMDEMRAATTHTWTNHARKMLSSVTSSVEKSLGGKLSDRQRDRIERAYVEEAKADPAFMQRHEAGDPKLVDEFVKGWLDDFVEPGKRQAQAADIARRPRVPSGKDRSIVGADNKPIDVKDDKQVEDMLVKGFRERGGQFGRR